MKNYWMFSYRFILTLLMLQWIFCSQSKAIKYINTKIGQNIRLGADQTEKYFPLLRNKKIGLVVNQTSILSDGEHLVDMLIDNDIYIRKIFAPEHGFRGIADAGQKLTDGTDPKTGIKTISLYGKTKKPSSSMLTDLEYIVFDIQDVGVRFYTYISTMHYVMEACAEHNIPILVLDRPNPNGHYVDGPLLEASQKSFVGMHPIPVVHGLTIGELANMINGENWLSSNQKAQLTVIAMTGWNHNMHYQLPVKPSPNLPNETSISLYPSLCFFEGTIMSVGRGTTYPFQVFGHPSYTGDFAFTPQSMTGASSPKYQGEACKGYDLRKMANRSKQLRLDYLIKAYRYFKSKNIDFFTPFFSLLAGTTKLQDQIESGMNEEQIRISWQKDLAPYKVMRSQYLLYP